MVSRNQPISSRHTLCIHFGLVQWVSTAATCQLATSSGVCLAMISVYICARVLDSRSTLPEECPLELTKGFEWSSQLVLIGRLVGTSFFEEDRSGRNGNIHFGSHPLSYHHYQHFPVLPFRTCCPVQAPIAEYSIAAGCDQDFCSGFRG